MARTDVLNFKVKKLLSSSIISRDDWIGRGITFKSILDKISEIYPCGLTSKIINNGYVFYNDKIIIEIENATVTIFYKEISNNLFRKIISGFETVINEYNDFTEKYKNYFSTDNDLIMNSPLNQRNKDCKIADKYSIKRVYEFKLMNNWLFHYLFNSFVAEEMSKKIEGDILDLKNTRYLMCLNNGLKIFIDRLSLNTTIRDDPYRLNIEFAYSSIDERLSDKEIENTISLFDEKMNSFSKFVAENVDFAKENYDNYYNLDKLLSGYGVEGNK